MKQDYINAIIKVQVPKWQIGEEVQVYFPDTMCIKGKCEIDTQILCCDNCINENSKNKEMCEGCEFYGT